MSIRSSVLAIVLVAGLASAAPAAQIQYIFTGLGTGSIGQTSFTRAKFTIISNADTSGIFSSGTLSQVNASSATIDIEGVGSATFLIATRVFLNKPFSGNATVGFSRTDATGGLDLYDLRGPELNTYNLANEFAQTPLPVSFIGQWTNNPAAQTTLGLVNITSATDGTFAAVIPAPGAVAALGLAGLVATRRRRSV